MSKQLTSTGARRSAWVAPILVVAAACGGDKGGPAKKPDEAPAKPVSELRATRVTADLGKPDPDAAFWADVPRGAVTLTAQPMVTPRPETTTTEQITVQVAHDGKTIAFRVVWADPELSEAGRLGEFSDALALQFPIAGGANTPVMMGSKDNPVHIFHWRAQYQRDRDRGKPTVAELYPNASIDMYPMDFKEAPGGTESDKEAFSPGLAAGNPQAYSKTGIDEIIAEGFSTSSVQGWRSSQGQGVWADGKWTLVLTRPLAIEGGSTISAGGENYVAFAAWQGGKGEVGSRKCVTMAWLPLKVQ